MQNKVVPALILGLLLINSCIPNHEIPPAGFQIYDPDLTLELIAMEPDIRTPIGMAIDSEDNLYVLESHTHTPPEDYGGPSYDRIKRGVDENADGIPESWMVFADSLEDGMNLAFGPQQQLFVTTKNQVWVFEDHDQDGVSESRKLLLDMVIPESPYDHAAILGLAVSPDHQWLFVSRGNTGSWHWVIKGTDGSSIEGYGDGGNVIRCKLDGSSVEEVATGFWNPFDIKFLTDGRLLLTDNDPDSRGPNRLVELVPGGDYGYKSLYGGSGIHPFLSWNGELPGTLPYAAPLGEAACAVLDGAQTGFGDAYQNTVLVNIWEEKNIVKIPLTPFNSTVTGTPEVLIQGDSTFHPVALTTNSKGEVYITDWVVRQYPNHGYGKIWRLSSKRMADPEPQHSMDNYRFETGAKSKDESMVYLTGDDPFLRTIGRFELLQKADYDELTTMLQDEQAAIRLQALLVLSKRQERLDNGQLRSLLFDQAHQVRRMALYYIGTRQVDKTEGILNEALSASMITPDLFEAYLAAMQNIQPEFIQGYQQKTRKSNSLPRALPSGFVMGIILNDALDPGIRALALPYLDLEEYREELLGLLEKANHQALQLSLIRAINNEKYKFKDQQKVGEVLFGVSRKSDNASQVRAHAVAAVPTGVDGVCELSKDLLSSGDPLLQYAAVKQLCQCQDQPELEELIKDPDLITPVIQEVWLRCRGEGASAISMDQWTQAVDGGGDPLRGELVFSATSSMCQTCHMVEGWGGSFGPELSGIGSSKNQTQLINAMLYPSMEMAPEWQGWYVIDQDGNRHIGRQIDVKLKNVELMNIDGEFITYQQPKSYGVSDKSVMPEGLQNSMTLGEFNDLIAYLMSLK